MLTERERKRVEPFVTSLDSNVYALKNLPPQLAGAVISRFSRTHKGARELLATEFSNDLPKVIEPELDEQESTDAAAFYDRVLGAYGDDSIAELGNVHIIIENVSALAAKFLEDHRLIACIEKSTRYVSMDRKEDGRYPYVIPAEFDNNEKIRQGYVNIMDRVFDRYHELKQRVIEWQYSNPTPEMEGVSAPVLKRAIHAKALDVVRGILPLSLETTLGIYANARTYEYMMYCLWAEDLVELRDIADKMYAALETVMPAMVRRVKTDKGQWAIQRLREHFKILKNKIETRQIKVEPSVDLIEYDDWGRDRVLAHILFESTNMSHNQIQNYIGRMGCDFVRRTIQEYAGERRTRYDRVGRAFEKALYTYEIVSTIGAWRDLQRHRISMQGRQDFTTQLGYDIPAELQVMGLEDQWTDAVGNAGAFASFLSDYYSADVSAYATSLCYHIRWRIQINARNLYHLVELRTQPAGHAEYRNIAYQMYSHANEIHPEIMEYMKFVFHDAVQLPRLKSEQRIEDRTQS